MKEIDYENFCKSIKIGARFWQCVNNVLHEYYITRITKKFIFYKAVVNKKVDKTVYKTDLFDLYYHACYEALHF